jgi:NADH-quinone oxidoreductase subunit L
MSQILQLFILLPLLGFLLSLLVPRKKEKIISGIAIATTAICLAGIITFGVYWILHGRGVLDIKHIVLYKTTAFEFFIDFYFDKITAVFALTGSGILLLVAIFSRYYLHRDEGFKRFFSTLLLFLLGFNLVIFSGNFETLFIGWEILGLCSFLLIAFYRDRYLPVKNALKVISVYRLGDVCLMLAMWMCHHVFHENITFVKLNNAAFVENHMLQYPALFIFISIMIFMGAAAKSALLPFASWLPRAMEGPTTSTAVFYGSLSVHLGAFLLLRTYFIWEDIPAMQIVIIALGAFTSIVATAIARVQSTVKTQIAYASITQIGLIFIEIALGFHFLALIHFAGNAFLRTYQLLVSPSVLSYKIHDMFFNFKPESQKQRNTSFQKIKNAIYLLSIKEWNLDWLMYRFLWNPFKWIGRNTSFLVKKGSLALLAIFFLGGLLSFMSEENIPEHLNHPVALGFSLLGLLLVLTAFAERGNAKRAWFFVIAAQCFVVLSIAFNEDVIMRELLIYLSGIVIAAVVGYACLYKIKQIDNEISLNQFHGYSYEKPGVAFVFLLSCLALIYYLRIFIPTRYY